MSQEQLMQSEQKQSPPLGDDAVSHEMGPHRTSDPYQGMAAARLEARTWQDAMSAIDNFRDHGGAFPGKFYEMSSGSKQLSYSYLNIYGQEVNDSHKAGLKPENASLYYSYAGDQFRKFLETPDQVTPEERMAAANRLAKVINSEFVEGICDELVFTQKEMLRNSLFAGVPAITPEEIAKQNGDLDLYLLSYKKNELAEMINDSKDKKVFLKAYEAQERIMADWKKAEATSDKVYTGNFIKEHEHLLQDVYGPQPASQPQNSVPANNLKM